MNDEVFISSGMKCIDLPSKTCLDVKRKILLIITTTPISSETNPQYRTVAVTLEQINHNERDIGHWYAISAVTNHSTVVPRYSLELSSKMYIGEIRKVFFRIIIDVLRL